MSTDKVKILIADDETIGRELLEAILFPEGYELVFSKDGREALDAAIEHRPDIILLDVMMPKMDGFEVCEKLRSNNNTAYTPIFLITALDDRDSKIRGIDAGADDYISKPFDRVEILAKVKNSANLIRHRNQSKDTTSPDQVKSSNMIIREDLLEKYCEIQFLKDSTDRNVRIYHKNNLAKSTNAFFHTKLKNSVLYFLVSNSLKAEEAVIMNLIFRELLLKNSVSTPDSPLKILEESLLNLHAIFKADSITESGNFTKSVLIVLHDHNTNRLTASGIKQSFFAISDSKVNDLSSEKTSYQPVSLSENKEIEILNVRNFFLFSSNIYGSFKEKDIGAFLNSSYSSESQINLSKAIEKFNNDEDILIVNISL